MVQFDTDSVKKYRENAESWAGGYSRMRVRRLRPDAELIEGATNGCEDKKEFSDEDEGIVPNYLASLFAPRED